MLLFSGWALQAQTEGTYTGYTPYSVFGVGELHQSGTAWNRGMGGVGIAARNNRYINILNPASVTARDTLSFMADFGLSGRISMFTEGENRGANNIVNIDDFVISFPMWKNTAFMAGIRPLTDVGYNISSKKIDLYTYQETFTSYGSGGLYQVFGAAAITLWDRLSIGAQANYNFGNINKKANIVYADQSYRNTASGDSLQINNVTAKIGLQYVQPLAVGHSLTLGATYEFGTRINGYHISYRELGSYSYARKRNQELLNQYNMQIGSDMGVGISYRNADKLMIEVDYTLTNWTRSRMNEVAGFSNVGDVIFAPGIGQSVRAGFELTPNRSDIRYYLRRCTYRAGAFYDRSYYTVNGDHINSVGVNLGITLPVFRWYNGLSIGLEFGQRGLSSNFVRENYFGFSVGMNVFDIWFQKRSYE